MAVERYLDGYSISEIGCFLGVDASSVRRWVACFRQRGIPGIIARPVPGRPRKLTRTQEKIVLRWLIDNPMDHGFATELWTAGRLAELMQREWRIELNHQYLARWLRTRGLSPQKPQRAPRERSPQAIAAWLDDEWTRLKKRRGGNVRT